MPVVYFAQDVWRLLFKDLRCEFRARMTWPAIVLFGVLLVLILELQTELPSEFKQQIVGGSLWLGVFIAGSMGFERSMADENQQGCWDALRMYPVSPAVIYTAKLLFNLLMLCIVTAVLIPLLSALSGAPFLNCPLSLLAVSVSANAGLAAVGTLVAALVNRMRRRGNLVTLLLMPLVLPVLMGASEATRLVIAGELHDDFSRWLQLLGAFSVIFITAGVLAFELVLED
jgi:heme exporter protein B